MASPVTEIRGALGRDYAVADGIYPTYSVSQSSGTGTERLLICNIAWQSYLGSTPSINTITYGGVALTLGRNISLTNSPFRTGVYIYYMLESDLPASGASATFEVSWNTGSPTEGTYSVWTAVYDNVAQVAPFATEFKLATFGGGTRTVEFDTDISEASNIFVMSFEDVNETPAWTLNNGLTTFKEHNEAVGTGGFNWTANNLIDAPADTFNFTNSTDDDGTSVVGIAVAFGTGGGIQLVQPLVESGTFDGTGTATTIATDRTESAGLSALCLADTDLMYVVWLHARQTDAEPLVDHMGFGTVSGYTNPVMTLAASSVEQDGTTWIVTKMYYMLEADLPGTTATGWNWGVQWDANGGTNGGYHVRGQLLRGVKQAVPFDTDTSSATNSLSVTSTIDTAVANSIFTGGTMSDDGVGFFLTANNSRSFVTVPDSGGTNYIPYPYFTPNFGPYQTYLLNVDPAVTATYSDDVAGPATEWATGYVTLEPSQPFVPVTTVDASLLLGVS